jgi:Na+-transporting NADH:ubiquinone oxidoreductase subunit C
VHKNSYVIMFAAAVTIICSLLLASAATLLRDRQRENVELDMRKNILASVGLMTEETAAQGRKVILKVYDENIRSMVINTKGEVEESKSVDDLDPKKDLDLLPLFYSQSNGAPNAYIVPVSGKGLWSTIYGYLALEPDLNTVKGITFYQHGETPGLGGEIEKEWFTGNFVGKKILNPQGELVSVGVVKGKVVDRVPESEAYHYVDGISGATLTGNGVDKFLKTELAKYEPYFKTLRNQGTEQ